MRLFILYAEVLGPICPGFAETDSFMCEKDYNVPFSTLSWFEAESGTKIEADQVLVWSDFWIKLVFDLP